MNGGSLGWSSELLEASCLELVDCHCTFQVLGVFGRCSRLESLDAEMRSLSVASVVKVRGQGAGFLATHKPKRQPLQLLQTLALPESALRPAEVLKGAEMKPEQVMLLTQGVQSLGPPVLG